MIDLSFEVTGSEVEPYAAVPTISLGLRIAEGTGVPVHALVLRVQVRIEPQRRRYRADERDRLVELFGDAPQWGESLRPFQWAQLSAAVPSFRSLTEVQLPLTCTYDLEVAGTKYLYNVRSGEIPIVLLFSGTALSSGPDGLVVEPVPWHLEARYRLPVAHWRRAIESHFPNSAWLRLSQANMDALQAFRARQALPTWDHAIEHLLKLAGSEPS